MKGHRTYLLPTNIVSSRSKVWEEVKRGHRRYLELKSQREARLPVPGWAGLYEVSSLGRVRSLPRTIVGKRKNREYPSVVLAGSIDRHGYKRIILRDRGRLETFAVHRLVCLVFHADGQNVLHREVDHIDRNRLNNRASNLRWVSHSENSDNRSRPTGARAARLDADLIAIIRSSEESAKTLAAQFGISVRTIYDLRRKRERRWITKLIAASRSSQSSLSRPYRASIGARA
jgi:hypothetical protein